MDVLHWDDVPKGAVFAVSKFTEGPYPDAWGIKAKLDDGRIFWVLISQPPQLVAVPKQVMAQSILHNLREYSRMMEKAKGEAEDPFREELPDPLTFPAVNWDEVPESVRLKERQLRGDIWGIVALMPDGEHLVLLDRFARDAGYHNFSANREEAQKAIAWLEMTQTPSDPAPTPPFVPEGEPPVLSDFDEREHFADILVAINEYSKKDRERIATLEQEWRRRLKEGNRRSCLCGQCRYEIRHKVVKILDWYEESMGYIPSELRLDSLRLLDLLARK